LDRSSDQFPVNKYHVGVNPENEYT